MTLKKLYSEAYNFVMTLLIHLTAAILLQKTLLTHLPPWAGVLYCSPCFLVYFAGRILHRKRPAVAITIGSVISLVLSAVPIFLAYAEGPYQILGLILIPILTFALFITAYITGPGTIGTGRFMSGILIFVVCILFGGAHAGSYKVFLNTAAIIFLIAGLFAFNRENLLDATKQDPKYKKGLFPPGMRKSNAIMLTAIVALGLVLANLEKLRLFVIEAAKFIVRIFFAILFFILRLLGGGGGPVSDDTGGSPEFFEGPAKTPNPIVEMIVRIVIIIVIVAAAILALYFLFKAARKLFRNLPDWLKRLLSKLRSDDEEGYIDETEDLLGKGELRKEILKNLSEFWNRITYRPEKFEDMPDNRAKVRFVFKLLLKKVSYNKYHLLSRTPNELTGEAERILHENTHEFIDAYNRARYDSRDIPDEDAALARKIMRKL